MYRFTLLNKNQGYYVLNNSPEGWNKAKTTLKRSTTYHGITAEYSTELTFIKDGKAYIQSVYESEGIMGEIGIIISRMDPNSFKYETEYIGSLNLERYEVNETSVKTNIEQTGFAMRFINSDDLEINLQSLVTPQGEMIGSFNPDTVSLPLHSKVINREYRAKLKPDTTTFSSIEIEDSSDLRSATWYIGWDEVERNDLKAFTMESGFSYDDLRHETVINEEPGEALIRLRLVAEVKIELISGDFDKATIQYVYQIGNRLPVAAYNIKDEEANGDFIRTVDVDIELEQPLAVGEVIKFWGVVKAEDVAGNYHFKFHITPDPIQSFISIQLKTQTETTSAVGMMNHEVLSRLVQAMTGKNRSLYSEFFGRTDSQPISYAVDGPGAMVFQTNGSQLRGFPLEDRPLKTTFKDWYTSNDAVWSIGTGIEVVGNEERVRVEDRGFFYSKNVCVTLGQVSKLKKSVASEYYYNELEFGYQKWSTESPNGLDEFNSIRKYGTPISKVKRKYSALSKYVGSGYPIEETRRKRYSNTMKEDSSDDSDNYIICVLRNGTSFITERNQLFTVLQNVESPSTVYNARISPVRNLYRHARTLKAGLLHEINKFLIFTTGEGNYKMASQMADEAKVIVENQNITIAEMPEPYFIPEYYFFSYPLRYNEFKLIKAKPYELIAFYDSSQIIKQGHLMEMNYSPQEITDFKLLRVI